MTTLPDKTGRTPAEKQQQRGIGSEGGAVEGAWQQDLEKQCADHEGEREHMPTRRSAIQAMPGLRLEDDDSEEYGEDRGREGGERSGLGGVLDRVVSRVSTKSSWNSGPPPDGGVKAWTAGMYP